MKRNRGEDRVAKLIYLAVHSRLFARPVSVVVKGTSSGGKSFTVQLVLDMFPTTAYHSMSAMSPKALVYSDLDFRHTFLVIFEAEGMKGSFLEYALRTLLSEGRLKYNTVENSPKGPEPRQIVKQGPTGLITTTTLASLHPENETRMFSVEINSSKSQTTHILNAIADDGEKERVNLEAWYALDRWISASEPKLTIPYAKVLANAVDPVAERIRRDFSAFLTLIKSHAMIHQATRIKPNPGST